MARSFVLAGASGSLEYRCRQRADMENSDHIPTAEWKTLIAAMYAKLHAILVSSGLRFFESAQTVSSASMTDNGDGGKYIALPSDYLGTSMVYYQESGGRRCPLDELMAPEDYIFSGNAIASNAIAYTVVGSNLVLYPSPPTGQTYKHLYVPQPADYSASSDGTTIDLVLPEGEEFVVWGVVVRALQKEESDTSVAERNFAQAEANLRSWAELKAITSTKRRIVDDTYDSGLMPGDYRWGR